jgi:hypothetical protein
MGRGARSAALVVALAGCAQTSSGVAGVHPSVSEAPSGQPSSAFSSPQSSSGVPSPAASSTESGPRPSPTGLCGGDVTAARAVAVYRAMLIDPQAPVEGFGSPKKLYVSADWYDGVWGPGVPTGRLEAAVLQCLTAGVPGLPPITIVPRLADPSIPTVVAADGMVGFADGARAVTFGDVRGTGTTVTSFVGVYTGIGLGQASGAKFTIHVHGETVLSVKTDEQWTS